MKLLRTFSHRSRRGTKLSEQLRRDYFDAYFAFLSGNLGNAIFDANPYQQALLEQRTFKPNVQRVIIGYLECAEFAGCLFVSTIKQQNWTSAGCDTWGIVCEEDVGLYAVHCRIAFTFPDRHVLLSERKVVDHRSVVN